MARTDDITKAVNAAINSVSTDRDAKYWNTELTTAKKKIKAWHEQGEKVLDRYLDKRDSGDDHANYFNLFNSNTGIMLSALYARIPEPDVSRRHRDAKDQVGRVASIILQRCLSYELATDHYFDTTAKNIIFDRLTAGAGVGWTRYDVDASEAVATEEFQITDDQDEVTEKASPAPVINEESTPIDYIHWKDFFWSPARTWDEVRWVARRVFMEKSAIADRFGAEVAETIVFNIETKNKGKYSKTDDVAVTVQEAEIYEVWDKTTKMVYFVSLDYDDLLDEKKDPLELPGFFPTGKPLFANVTTSEMLPRPDYVNVQDQYEQLNNINNRISIITDAIRVVGVYDSKQIGLKEMLNNAAENQMIPVENWAAFAESSGGLRGSMDFLPTQPLAEVLVSLQKAREETKAQIYELTGISDIIRGQSQQYVTAQAESMKGQYASLRLTNLQQAVAEYFSTLINLKAHLICKFYEPKRILERCGQLFDNDLPYVNDALALLKNEGLRHFRVNVSVDSLQMADWNADKKGKAEVLMAVTQFMSQVLPAVKQTPEIAPLALNMLRFGITGYKGAEVIEGVIEDGLRDIEKAAQQKANTPPAPPPPSPEQIKLQLEQTKIQGDMQIAQAKMAADQERAKDQLALDQARASAEAELAQIKAQTDMQLAERKLALEEAKVELERQRLILEQKKLVADIHLKTAPAATQGSMVSLDQGANFDDVLPMADMDTEVQQLVAQERDRHFTKEEFVSLASQMLAEMRNVADGISDALNTAVNSPMPPQTISITKTDNGLTGTIQ